MEAAVNVDDGGRLARHALSDETRRARTPGRVGAATSGPEPRPPRRTLRSDLRRIVGTPAHRARVLLVVVGLAVVVAGPLVTRAGATEARAEAATLRAERSAAAELRDATEAVEADATAAEARAQDLAAQALVARNEQRARLAALGLNEQTIDAFLDEVTANADLVEFRRDRETGDVNRRAGEIPQMEECIRIASRTLNSAFNRIIDPNLPVPGPSDLCVALLAAGT